MDSWLGGYWVHVVGGLFFKKYLKDSEFNSRFKMNPSLNSLIQPKARGLLYTEWDGSSHPPYMKIISEGFKTIRVRAPRSLGAVKEVLGWQDQVEVQRTHQRLQKYSEDFATRLQRTQGLLDTVLWDIRDMVRINTRYGMEHVLYPYAIQQLV